MRVESDVFVTASDGVRLAVRLYLPDAPGQYPALLAASPYRYDNDDVPPTGMFLWHEIGPLPWYVEQGYAYVRLDVRGSGKSGGDYAFFDKRERRDLYEIVEWMAQQPWCNGRVGGFGQSYYARAQWCMAAERPPHLACIAPYDGHIDIFDGWSYPGGIPSAFMPAWWNTTVRPINLSPAGKAAPRDIALDLPRVLSQHPNYDDFWRERDIAEALTKVDVPVYSIGVWAKRDLHLNGNILGYQKVRGPKKLRVSGAPSPVAAHKEFSSLEFHQSVLLPFYDHYLKGVPTSYTERPEIEYYMRGEDRMVGADQWPPRQTTTGRLNLSGAKSGSVNSLNDGSLSRDEPTGTSTSYSYPDKLWALGHVAMGPHGADPVARVLTFTSPPLDSDLAIVGPLELVLFASSNQTDADFIVKLSEQLPQPQQAGAQPPSTIVTKGWLRASHRAIDQIASKPGAPVLTHLDPSELVPDKVYEFRIPLMPAAYRFKQGSRIRVEIACADSPVTEAQWWHLYTPNRAGTDTIHHSPAYRSHLVMPLFTAN